jgi:glyoxylase-like metal-dependent hydrolase (beta-lactamase superfamily II)
VVVRLGADAVQKFFGFENWPNDPAHLELGDRRLELLPIPGHKDDDIAFYDPTSRFAITGDTLYPGRLYVGDWAEYRASIARLNEWIQDKPVVYVMGTHIEMTAAADVDYPIGANYQPNEHELPLRTSDIAVLHEALVSMKVPERRYLGSFIVWPSQ